MRTSLGNLTIEPFERKMAVFEAIADLIKYYEEDCKGELVEELLDMLGNHFLEAERDED